MFLSSRSSHGAYGFQYAGAIRRRNQIARLESEKDSQASKVSATEGALYPVSVSTQESAIEHDLPRMTGPERLLSSKAENQIPLLQGEEKLIIVMVGLPARGKSYIARKVCRYLNWLQYPTKVFNVGEMRRKSGTRGNRAAGLNSDKEKNQPGNVAHTAAFFDPDDQNATQVREQIAMEVLDDLLQYLQGDGKVAIFDATNTTTERRALIVKRVMHANSCLKILFIESQCFNQTVRNIPLNFYLQQRLANPDRCFHQISI
jgi:6-phosphofructo-2-kinase